MPTDGTGVGSMDGQAVAPVTQRARRRPARLAATGLCVLLGASLVQASVPILAARTITLEAGYAGTVQPGPISAVGEPGATAGWLPSRATRRPDPGSTVDGRTPTTAPAAEPEPVRLGPPARVVYRVRTSAKVVALTFDDGWSPAAGRLILDTLVRLHVKATFFVNATYVRWDPRLWKDIAAAGFPIGNHTYDHRDLTTLSYAAIQADLAKDARVVRQLTGVTLAPIVRPPYGARNPTVDAAILAAGYPTEVLWDTVAGDSALNPNAAREIADATKGRPGSIVLLHVGPSSTPRILAAVIASYRGRGFAFVTIPELLALGRGA